MAIIIRIKTDIKTDINTDINTPKLWFTFTQEMRSFIYYLNYVFIITFKIKTEGNQ